MNNLFCLGLRALVCCLMTLMFMIGPAYAAAPIDSNWNVPFVGQLTGPDGFKAIDFENWLKELQASLPKDKAQKSEEAATQIAKNASVMPEQFRFYQLQVNDGKVFHTAFAMVLRDSKGMVPELSTYFADTLPAEQTKQLSAMNDRINLGIKIMQNFSVQTGVLNIRVLDVKPLERLKDTGEVIYSLRGRVILDMHGMIYPLFTKGYVLARGGKGVLFVVLTADSEGPFWEKLTDEMMKTMVRTITFSTSLN